MDISISVDKSDINRRWLLHESQAMLCIMSVLYSEAISLSSLHFIHSNAAYSCSINDPSSRPSARNAKCNTCACVFSVCLLLPYPEQKSRPSLSCRYIHAGVS